MPASPITVEDFRGLRLLPEQGEANGAVSMLNTDFTRGPTQIGTRGGLALLATGTAPYHRLAAVGSDTLAAIRNTGATAAWSNVTISTGVVGGEATWGAANTFVTGAVPTSNGLIVVSRTGAANEALRSFGGPILGQGSPRYAAITSTDQRFVQAHYTAAGGTPSGADGTTSTVFFSDPSAMISYGSTNWVKLDPDDGDEITGMVTWRDLLFVIKRSHLYIFTTDSIDTLGAPIFNYRKVNLPSRARATHDLGGENIVAAGDGVYLLLGDGVYRTTGDVPQMVSRDITPLFDGTGDVSMAFPSNAGANWSISYAANRIYLSYTVGASFRTLVYDTLLGEWLFWDLTAGASSRPSNVLEWLDPNGLPTSYVASGAKILSFAKTATSDAGTAIVSSYQSGFEGLGMASQEKRLRNIEVVGTGAPTFTVLTDYATTDPLARQGTVTLGTSPAVSTAVHPKAYHGRLFSYKFSATSGAWSVARLTWNVQSVRAPGLRSA